MHVDNSRGISRVDALTLLLFRDSYILAWQTMQDIEPTPGTFLVAPQEKTKGMHYKQSGKCPTPINTSRRSPISPETYTASHSLPNGTDIGRDSMAKRSSEVKDLETEY